MSWLEFAGDVLIGLADSIPFSVEPIHTWRNLFLVLCGTSAVAGIVVLIAGTALQGILVFGLAAIFAALAFGPHLYQR